jgi:uridylate kinase
MSWEEFRNLVGEVWQPGMHVPFDPIAAKKSQELGVRTIVLSGDDFANIENYCDGKQFVGTIIG